MPRKSKKNETPEPVVEVELEEDVEDEEDPEFELPPGYVILDIASNQGGNSKFVMKEEEASQVLKTVYEFDKKNGIKMIMIPHHGIGNKRNPRRFDGVIFISADTLSVQIIGVG